MGDNLSWPGGRQSHSVGSAALSCSVPCKCGSWEFRDLVLCSGLVAIEKHCPERYRSGKCGRGACVGRNLMVFRDGEHMATVAFKSYNARALRSALQESGLAAHEVDLLMRLAS